MPREHVPRSPQLHREQLSLHAQPRHLPLQVDQVPNLLLPVPVPRQAAILFHHDRQCGQRSPLTRARTLRRSLSSLRSGGWRCGGIGRDVTQGSQASLLSAGQSRGGRVSVSNSFCEGCSKGFYLPMS
jgi:hypothetical protein